jgi:predicted enzyme related to lactoylglutathione lyase
MSAPTTTGRFVWHELHTADRPAATKFYTRLLSWGTKDVPMGPGEPYTLCVLNGQDIAGITKSKAPASVPPHWLPYFAVEDVDSAAKKAASLGGKVLTDPMDIPNVGRFAVIGDPQGAAFALFKDVKPYPQEPERPGVGTFCWEELHTTDPEAAAKFYAGLFGYTVDSQDMGPMGTYRILKRGDRQTAGVMKKPPQAPASYWLEYVAVKEVDASTRSAKELGANVLVTPTDIPNVGRFSVIADPTGAVIGLFMGS